MSYLPIQTPNERVEPNPLSWLQGGGEMGALIRGFDWQKTSIGSTAQWPQTLRTIVNMMLQSPVPMVLLWGKDGIMIYNDPYSGFAGSRHPFLLGSKVLEGWPEVADFNRNVMDKGLKGHTLSYKDQRLTLYRNDGPEEVWMDLNYSPILDECGKPAGVLSIVVETTERVKAELALRESEERFRTMADSAPVMIWMSQANGALIYQNNAFARFYGLNAASNEALDWAPYVHPDDIDWVKRTFNEALIAQKAFNLPEHRLKRHDGEYRWLIANGEPRLNPDGAFMGFIGSVVDITERKNAEDALRESETRFRIMSDSAPLFIWTSGPDGNTNYVNKAWQDFLDTTPENAVEAIKNSMLPEEQAVASQKYREAFAKQEPYTLEGQFKRADSQLRWILTKGSPFFLAGKTLAGYIGISMDITDRKLVETQLEGNLERERLIRKIVEIIGHSFDIDVILKTVAEEVGRYLKSDRSSVSRYSMLEGELILNLSAQYVKEGCKPVDPDDVQRIANAVRHLNPDAMNEGQTQITNIPDQEQYVQHLRARMQKFSGAELPGLTCAQLIDLIYKYGVQSSLRVNIHYRGTAYGSISVSQCTHNRVWTQDEVELLKTIAEHAGSAIYQAELYRQAQETAIKEQNARQVMEGYAKRLEASNKELEQFATIASHDLSEPLRKIQVLSEMLESKVPDTEKDHFNRILSAANRMRALMDDLLALSRVNRKGQSFQTIDLNELVKTVLDDMQVTIQQAQAQIDVNQLPFVQGDYTQIRQLFQNLISNAIKYQRSDVMPVVRISGKKESQQYIVCVDDNGIGIAKVHWNRIFEPFQRLHGMGQYPGTGMGLAICRKIVERHGGVLTVESEPQQGSRFTFSLPIST